MALRRMVPTNFFKDPDILNLKDKDTRLILLGLILLADDEGRGVAHPSMLGREWDYLPEQVEAALADLARNDLIVLYQVGKHRYYSLNQWAKWQTINRKRMTPSRYPAPEQSATDASAGEMQVNAEKIPACAGETPVNAEKIPAQSNLIESNLIEDDGGTPAEHSNITPFPTTHTNDTNDEDVHAPISPLTQEVAHILKLPVCHALTRLVALYGQDPALSLLIEADAARAWIDDHLRNRSGKPMTVTFFRTWLKRERKDTLAGHSQATGTDGPPVEQASRRTAPPASPGAPVRKSLMGLEDEYRAHCNAPREKGAQRDE